MALFDIILNCLCQCIGSANDMNKLSLVGMQLPEKYKENFDVLSEGPGVTTTSQSNSRRKALA